MTPTVLKEMTGLEGEDTDSVPVPSLPLRCDILH